MANAYKSTTKVWIVVEPDTLEEGGCEIQYIEFIPSAVSDDLVLTDNADNAFLALKCRSDITESIHRHFNPPIKLPSLKVATCDGSGSSTVYIQFRTDMKS